MTVKDIELAVRNIARMGNDDPEMTREVLKIIDIDFPRWYA